LAIAVGVFAAPAAVEYLNGRFLPRSTPGTGGYRVLRSMRLAAAAGIAVALTVAISLVSRGPPSEPLFPEKAVEAIRRGKLAGGMLVDFDWAQYAIFHLAPDVKVAFDGRYEAVYPAAVVGEYGDWYFGRGSKDILIREPQTRIALVASNSARHRDLRQQPGWTQFYADATAAVLVKDSPDLDKHVGPTTDP
jgi:hypothetical protein